MVPFFRSLLPIAFKFSTLEASSTTPIAFCLLPKKNYSRIKKNITFAVETKLKTNLLK